MSIDTPPPAVQPEPPRTHKDAKADAKSAKAYAKAQRSWYQKKRYIFSLGAFLLIIVVTATSGGNTDSTKTGPDNNAAPAPATSQPENQPAQNETTGGPTAKLPIQNGDWRMDSIRVKDDGLGDFGGVARVTYTGANPAGGTNLFTLTVFVGGKDVAVLNGSAEDVKPGTAETVQFFSSDNFVGGPYKFDFQNDL